MYSNVASKIQAVPIRDLGADGWWSCASLRRVILRLLPATRAGRPTGGRHDAALSIEVQLYAGDVGEADRQPRGPPSGRSVVHRVGWWQAARVLVRLRRARWLQPL